MTQDTQSDRIALKNALREAVDQLQAVETNKRAILPIEDAVDALVEDDDFWATRANGLGVFVTPDFLRTFRLPSRLETMVQVSDRFHLKPLLRSVTFPQDAAGADSYGIIDGIVSRALKSGATIVSARKADIPGGGSLGAILRFAI